MLALRIDASALRRVITSTSSAWVARSSRHRSTTRFMAASVPDTVSTRPSRSRKPREIRRRGFEIEGERGDGGRTSKSHRDRAPEGRRGNLGRHRGGAGPAGRQAAGRQAHHGSQAHRVDRLCSAAGRQPRTGKSPPSIPRRPCGRCTGNAEAADIERQVGWTHRGPSTCSRPNLSRRPRDTARPNRFGGIN